ncbi:MAG: deaminase, partial [Gemmataceae bacterium]
GSGSETFMNQVARRFMEMAVEEAAKSVAENGKTTPKVGAVVVRGETEIARAYRGELAPGDHAEFTLLEKKCKAIPLDGTTVYATLEPCTKRGEGKIPCVERLIERKVARVIIGMLDPNDNIRGRGYLALRRVNVEIALFENDLVSRLEDMNREFIRIHAGQKTPTIEFPPQEPAPESGLALDLAGFLGMGWENIGTLAKNIKVSSFQAQGKNVAAQAIKQISGQLVVSKTGQTFPLYLVREGVITNPGELLALPQGHLVSLTIPFAESADWGRAGISDVDFLDNYTPFDVSWETELGRDELHFTLEMCDAHIRKLLDQGRSQGPIWRSKEKTYVSAAGNFTSQGP